MPASKRPGLSIATEHKQRLFEWIVRRQIAPCKHIIKSKDWAHKRIVCFDVTAGPGCHDGCVHRNLPVKLAGCHKECPETSSPHIMIEELRKQDFPADLFLCESNRDTFNRLYENLPLAWEEDVEIHLYPGDLNKFLSNFFNVYYRASKKLFGLVYFDPNGFWKIEEQFPGLVAFFKHKRTERLDLLINWSPTTQKRCYAAFDHKTEYDITEEINRLISLVGKRYSSIARIYTGDPQQFSFVFLTNWGGKNGARPHPVRRKIGEMWIDLLSRDAQERLEQLRINRH